MIKSNLSEDSGKERVDNFQKLLASAEDTKLIDLAHKLSPGNQFSVDRQNLGIKLTKDNIKKKFNVAFTVSEMMAECKRYNLAFVKSRNYTGEYSIDFLKKLTEFFKNTGIASSDDDYSRLVYILAPAVTDTSNIEIKYPCKDPLMFWKHSVEGEYYFILIDGDKNYINLLNLWRGFKNLSATNCRVAYFAETTVALSIIAYGIAHFMDAKLNLLSVGVPLGLIFIAAYAIQSLRMAFRKSKKGCSDFVHNSEFFLKTKCDTGYRYNQVN